MNRDEVVALKTGLKELTNRWLDIAQTSGELIDRRTLVDIMTLAGEPVFPAVAEVVDDRMPNANDDTKRAVMGAVLAGMGASAAGVLLNRGLDN
jgi:hypothetical protein